MFGDKSLHVKGVALVLIKREKCLDLPTYLHYILEAVKPIVSIASEQEGTMEMGL